MIALLSTALLKKSINQILLPPQTRIEQTGIFTHPGIQACFHSCCGRLSVQLHSPKPTTAQDLAWRPYPSDFFLVAQGTSNLPTKLRLELPEFFSPSAVSSSRIGTVLDNSVLQRQPRQLLPAHTVMQSPCSSEFICAKVPQPVHNQARHIRYIYTGPSQQALHAVQVMV